METTPATLIGCVLFTAGFCFFFERIYLRNIVTMSQGKRLGQPILNEAPERHRSKEGTPTMGGIAMILAFVLSSILAIGKDPLLYELIGVTLAYGLIGFLDDYIKVIKRRNLGLTAWQKILLQLLAAGVFAYFESRRSTLMYIPYVKEYVDLGGWAMPFIMLVMVATTNAVNLTDGLDGLASGVTAVVATTFAFFCYILGQSTSCLYACFTIGVCLGFLVYNHYPARVFMGDTGSLSLGAAVGAVAVSSGLELALVVVGGIYVAEALSVILQVFVFKTQHGKRLFRMAPLHHHLELGGWSENMVVGVFCFITLLLSIIMFPGI